MERKESEAGGSVAAKFDETLKVEREQRKANEPKRGSLFEDATTTTRNGGDIGKCERQPAVRSEGAQKSKKSVWKMRDGGRDVVSHSSNSSFICFPF